MVLGFHESLSSGIHSTLCPKIQKLPRLESLLPCFGFCSHSECVDRFVGMLLAALFHAGLFFLVSEIKHAVSYVLGSYS